VLDKVRAIWDRFRTSQGMGAGNEFPWHHIQPLKFGGDPTDLANLQKLERKVHDDYDLTPRS